MTMPELDLVCIGWVLTGREAGGEEMWEQDWEEEEIDSEVEGLWGGRRRGKNWRGDSDLWGN